MKPTRNYNWYKWEVLALLWVAFLLNQGDRQVFNSVLPQIRDSLSLTDTSVSLIAVFFNLFYALMVPLGGWVADKYSRKWVTTLSILFWSIATMFTGLANGVVLLIITRSIATGGGEAFFGPANYSLLGQYHTGTRALAMSIHQTAYYVGVILAGWLAGYIGDTLGWQYSFYIFGAAGVLWALVMAWRLKDAPHQESQAPKNDGISIWDGFRTVFTTPTALMVTIGFCGFIFVITGYMTWAPTFLQENFGQSGARAGLNSMLWTYAAAFAGVLLAGSLSDRVAVKNPARRMTIQGAGLLLGAIVLPFMGIAGNVWILYVCFALWGFFRAFFDSNIYAALYDVTPSRLHASCSSAMITTGFAVGATAPYILALIKEATGSLNACFPILGAIWLVCGAACLWVSRKYYNRDKAKMNTDE